MKFLYHYREKYTILTLTCDKQNDVLNEVDELASLRVSNKSNDRINFC